MAQAKRRVHSTPRRDKPKTTKRPAKAKSKVRDNGLWREWANADIEPEGRTFMRELYFNRRHLKTGIHPYHRGRELKYLIESEEMDTATWELLKVIHERDGKAIFEEVSRELLIGLFSSILQVGGDLPKAWRRMSDELVSEQQKEEAREDARARQRVRRGELPAIAA